jgi:hypothetical protein
MTDAILFSGCLLVFAAFVLLLLYFRTGLFGLTLLCVFHVTAATLSAFFFGYIFNERPDTFTPEHRDVWTYSIVGLLAMAGGVYAGWRPLKTLQRSSPRGVVIVGAPAHINERLGWLSFCVGIGAQVLLRLVSDVPTVSTAVNCISALARIGILILLASALVTGRWQRFTIAILVYSMLAVTGSLESGHSFIRIDTVLPIIVIYVASSGFAPALIIQGLLGFALLVPLVSAWMQSRDVIRSGSLENLDLFEKVPVFFDEFIQHVALPSAESVMELLLVRVDMTSGLAAQVAWQPLYEPYAYGETVYSAFYTLIPRFVWENKPIVAGGSEFFARYTGLVQPVDDVTSIGIAYPFELYANGGPILVVVGLAAIGFLCARLELKLLSAPKNLGRFWALAVVTMVLSDGGQRTDVVLPALVAAGLAAYALGRFIEVLLPGWGLARLRR